MFTEVRVPAEAGRFYPSDPAELAAFLAEHVVEEREAAVGAGRVRGIIVPHAGYRYSGDTAGRTFATVERGGYGRVLLLAPSHRVGFRAVSVAPFAAYRMPAGDCVTDVETAQAILESGPLFEQRRECHLTEHSLEVELPFVNYLLPDAQIVAMVCGQLSLDGCRQAGAALAPFWNDETLLVVSSDFTHLGSSFGFEPFSAEEAPEKLEALDRGAIDCIVRRDCGAFWDYLGETGATVCGRVPITILLAMVEALGRDRFTAELVDYTSTGKMFADYGHSVSYAGLAIRAANGSPEEETAEEEASDADGLSREEKALLLKIAREAIGSALDTSCAAPSPSLPDRFSEPAAVFVTLHLHGALRGCIGTMTARLPLAEAVREYAVQAAFGDSRFPSLTCQEFDEIDLEISWLTPMQPIDAAAEFIVGRHGVMLEQSGHRAVFLPQVAPEQGWGRETTLRCLCRKARLPEDAWGDPATRLWVFEAQVFGEQPRSASNG